MKTIITTTAGIIIAGLMLITSCKKDELITYEGKDQVYFYFASSSDAKYRVDSVVVALGYDTPVKDDSIIKIATVIQGKPVDYDRPIYFTVVDSLSTAKVGEDIELLYDNSYIYANSVYGLIQLKIIKTAKLTNTRLVATIRTMPNEYFNADYVQIRGETKPSPARKKANTFLVYFDAKNEEPNLWVMNKVAIERTFGEYSQVKFDFICEVLNLTREYFTYDPLTEDPTIVYNARFPSASMLGYGLVINRRLNQYEQEHGEKLKDENGNVVVINSSFN